jgi:hypothetical protein
MKTIANMNLALCAPIICLEAILYPGSAPQSPYPLVPGALWTRSCGVTQPCLGRPDFAVSVLR